MTSIGEILSKEYPPCKHSPLCPNAPLANGFCFRHQVKKDKAKGIAKVSDKRKELNKELAKVVKRLKLEHPFCEIRAEGCTGKTDCIHHKAGRIGTKLLDESYMMASCSNCNLWVEEHDAEARAKGFKLSQHVKI